ncbi:hypothetical protein [Acetobacter ascendens]|uniref:hypothetical protein n=1 Tax=Acetobacter ascendens TaxID=481146 RepID=UPI000A3F0B57|nr:hypothetical protein [Acetobacter ascendens]
MSETRTRRKPAAGKTVSKRKVATAAPKKRAPRAKVVDADFSHLMQFRVIL